MEFVVGQDKSFYFLEMNTRLQVEHPVTEFVTGVDLVEQMLRIASGEKLALRQQDIKLQGWAIESRLYAEDPARDFAPSTGRLARFIPPRSADIANGASLRIDYGVEQGDEIPVYYDPMIAKLITYAPTRAQAIAAQSRALECFEIDGVATNLGFCAALMRLERWQSGALATGLIAETYPQGFAKAELPDALYPLFIAIAASLDAGQEQAARARAGQDVAGFVTSRVVQLGEDRVSVTIRCEADGLMRLSWGSGGMDLQRLSPPRAGIWQGQIDGQDCACAVSFGPAGNYELRLHGLSAALRVLSPAALALLDSLPPAPARTGPFTLQARMPGAVSAISVAPGDVIAAGDTIMVIEAMKLESGIPAEAGGIVEAVLVTEGQIVTVGTELLRLRPTP